jgi:hypothetical protein
MLWQWLGQNDKSIGALVSILGFIVALGGGLYGVVQYVEAKEAARTENSIAYLNRYNSAPVLTARTRADELLIQEHPGFVRLFESMQDIAEYHTYFENFIQRNDVTTELMLVLSFYEELVTCMEANVCDSDTADVFFRVGGRKFVENYYPLICKLRREWKNPAIYKTVEDHYLGDRREPLCLEN